MNKKADDRFIDSKMLKTIRDGSKNVQNLLLDKATWETLNPITPARVGLDSHTDAMGYFATNDGRIALRLVCNDEAQRVFGVDSIDMQEAWYISFRLGEIGAMEQAALDAQRENVLLRRSLVDTFKVATEGGKLTKNQVAAASMILRDTDPNKQSEE